MGYMGLDGWGESDNAADLCFELQRSVQKIFDEEIVNNANNYNTPGPVNIGLLIEDNIFPIKLLKQSQVKLLKEGLNKLIKQSSVKGDRLNESNRLMHHNAYKRILRFVTKQESKYKEQLAYED